jgi:hypothetical protein
MQDDDVRIPPEEAKKRFPYLCKLETDELMMLLTDFMKVMLTKDTSLIRACMSIAETKKGF